MAVMFRIKNVLLRFNEHFLWFLCNLKLGSRLPLKAGGYYKLVMFETQNQSFLISVPARIQTQACRAVGNHRASEVS